MKIIGVSFALSLPVFSAVTVLPPPPSGFEWQLVTSGQTDSDVVDVSAVQTNLEAALGISGSGATPNAPTGSGMAMVTLTAFGSPNPATYSSGDTVDLVTANTYQATLDVSNTAGVQNPGGDFMLVESKLSGVQITSTLGATVPGSDVRSAGSTDPFVLVNSPNASASATDMGSFGEIEGESIVFTFTAADELDYSKPFGGTAVNNNYFISSTVNPSLRRDTTYDTYELVPVPEPSSALLVTLAAFGGLCFRRRA